MEKYGVKKPFESPEIRKKGLRSTLKKYGTLNTKVKLIQQNSIKKFLEDNGIKTETNIDILNGKEIDIYNEDRKIGIEYCGTYWHSQQFNKDKNCHYKKYIGCKQAGVRLITIFSNEWKNRRFQVENYLKSVFGIHDKKIMARKCEVKEIDKIQGKDFIETHHIQGQKKKALVYFGLVYENELIAVMSFSRHHRQNSDKTNLVLDRLAFKNGINISGGSSKLLSYGKNWGKNNGFNKIISWSDNRWSYGNVYEKIGFTKESELKPDYGYVSNSKQNHILSKQSLRKEEKERTLETNGFFKIYDCGKIRWVMEI